AIDKKKTLQKLQELLKREAEERGYPKQDVKALELYEDNSGNINFSIPLWLSPNSNRYESLLNSIVNNQLVNLKIPGNSLVAASEAGFKQQTDLKGIDESRIIFTNKYKGELKATYYEIGDL